MSPYLEKDKSCKEYIQYMGASPADVCPYAVYQAMRSLCLRTTPWTPRTGVSFLINCLSLPRSFLQC
jgi:hypothetical protein